MIRIIKSIFIVLLVCMLQSYLKAQKLNPFLLGNKQTIVFQKNLPVLFSLFNNEKIIGILENNSVLADIGKNNYDNLSKKYDFSKDKFDYYNSIRISDDDIKKIVSTINSLFKEEKSLQYCLGKFIKNYQFTKNDDATIIEKELFKELNAINHIIDVYGIGIRPNYYHIDSISPQILHDATSIQKDLAIQLQQEITQPKLFCAVALKTALNLLDINGRLHAADYEPMEQKVNLAAINKIPKINWSSYPYTHILIPGAGPDEVSDSISPGSILRCRLAALLYFQKKAPFIVTSGGRVHPYKTNYSEAEEMKKYLINELNIPASAIIMEPHARHTTTNIRNAVRLLIKYHIPLNKEGIISTVESQMRDIRSNGFRKRCMSEMGCSPYTIGKNLSITATSYTPINTALLIEPKDPLDP